MFKKIIENLNIIIYRIMDFFDQEDTEEYEEEVVEENVESSISSPLSISKDDNNSSNGYENLNLNIELSDFDKVLSEEETIQMLHRRQRKTNNGLILPIFLLDSELRNRNSYKVLEYSKTLISTLKHYGLEAKSYDTHVGPNTTLFEIRLENAFRTKELLELKDELKMALCADTLNIIAPIPGKNTIGIEASIFEREKVTLKELLREIDFIGINKKLLIFVGKDPLGKPCYADINKLLHVLISGSVGSGKSSFLHSVICSILMRNYPDEVKLILIDTKKSELSLYQGLPHLLAPIVKDEKSAEYTLKVLCDLVYERFDLFAEINVGSMKEYYQYVMQHCEENRKLLPRIVVIIDAYECLENNSKIESYISEIIRIGHSVGIHLIMSVQSPSEVYKKRFITMNALSKVAFKMYSQEESMDFIGSTGAESLLGKGDMLFFPCDELRAKRIQGVFVSEKEIEKITQYLSREHIPHYDDVFIGRKPSDNRKPLDSSHDDP